MNKQRLWTKHAAHLCAKFGAEDGVDPRYAKRHQSRKKTPRKNLQLCKEAARIVALVLTGETQHPVLRDLLVLSVEPENDGACICVTVGQYATDSLADETEVLAALGRVQGLLRSALAHALHRKHTPTLSFRYVGCINSIGFSQGGV